MSFKERLLYVANDVSSRCKTIGSLCASWFYVGRNDDGVAVVVYAARQLVSVLCVVVFHLNVRMLDTILLNCACLYLSLWRFSS